MAYRFPKRKVGAGEPADPRIVDENIRPVAHELSGRLNEHNLKAAQITADMVPSSTYYIPHYASAPLRQSYDGESTFYSYGIEYITLPDDGAWHAMDDIQLSFTTGEDLLWIVGWCQIHSDADIDYTLLGTPIATGDWTSNRTRRPRVQVAVRVDGVVLQETVTGTIEIVSQPPWGLDPKTPVADAVSIHPFKTAGCSSMVRARFSLRVQAHVPVQAGPHAAKLVLRRVPLDVSPDEITSFDPSVDNITVQVAGRRLLAMQIVQNAAATGTDDGVAVTNHVDQDPVTATSLFGGAIPPVASLENDLTDGTIIRHGLRQVHLPSRILYPCQVGLPTGPAGAVIDVVEDAGGTPLRTTNGPYDFDANPAFVVVMANVHVGQAGSIFFFRTTYADATYADDFDSVTVGPLPIPPPFAGGYCVGTGTTNLDGATPYETKANFDVPLFLCLDYRTTPPDSPLDYVDVRGLSDKVIRSNLLLLAFA
jgi:hypothetical protein